MEWTPVERLCLHFAALGPAPLTASVWRHPNESYKATNETVPMNKRRITYLSLLACIGFACGCSPSGGFSTVPPNDNQQTNATRARAGIRPIKKEWTFYGREFLAENWKDGTNLCKMVQRDRSGALVFEEDYYYSGATFLNSKGDTDWEFLSTHYEYGSNRVSLGYVGTNAAISALFKNLTLTPIGLKDQSGQQASAHTGTNNQETLDVADKALAIWGKTRL